MSIYIDVKKRMGDFTLEVQLEAKNEALGILGASGSGKSMTLHCVAGVLTPDSGEIVLDGKILYSAVQNINLPPQKRGVGLLFQSYALFPNFTVEQNIAAGVREKAARARLTAEYIALLRLQGLEKRRPAQLSGGQQQRVALARMMASQPDILMLDEPFSALDRHLRFTIEEEFAEALGRFHGTVLYVSHSVGEIYQYCARTAVLARGKVAECGTTEELFHTPKTVEGARLTGCKNLCAVGEGASGWNLPLPQALPAGVTALGVRETDLHLCAERCAGAVPVTVVSIRQFPRFAVLGLLPFGASRVLTCTVPKAEADVYRRQSDAQSLFLHVAPEQLLLLRGGL